MTNVHEVDENEQLEKEFKEKARRLLFNSELRHATTMLHLYVQTFVQAPVDLDWAMGEIIKAIRSCENSTVAYEEVCNFLDSLEISMEGK